MLDHALRTLGLPRVIADIDPNNSASIAVARKLGFTPDEEVPYGDRTVIRHVMTGTKGMA